MSTANGKSATEILREDHAKMEKLFAQYKATNDSYEKEDITQALSLELHRHILLEEQLFFPAVSQVMHADTYTDAAVRELDQAQLMMDKLQRLCAAEDREKYDSMMGELKNCVEHHIRSEEKILPEVEHSALDLMDLGKQFIAYKTGAM